MRVNPLDPANHGKPLWVVYGLESFPELLCVKLRAYTARYELLPVGEPGVNVCIWGYSVYCGKPGFHTLGSNVLPWIYRSAMPPAFFDTQDGALELLRELTTPAKECINTLNSVDACNV